MRAVAPEMGALDESGIARLLRAPVALAEPLSAALVWIEDRSDASIPDGERTRLAQQLVGALEGAPFVPHHSTF
jgi:hypothetical protein